MADFAPKWGGYCRVYAGPGRYVGRGLGLAIVAMDNDRIVGPASPPLGNEHEFPMPSDDELTAASVMHTYLIMIERSGAPGRNVP